MSAPKVNRNNPSLCIPRVFPNITWKRIKAVFEELGLGVVDRVDMVNKTNDRGDKFKRVFIHFKHWHANEDANAVKQKLISGDTVKIIYDDPWFWKVCMSNVPRPEFKKRDVPKKGAGKREKKPVRIMKDDAKEHPGDHTPAKAARELAAVKALMESQKAEIERMRAELAAIKTTDDVPTTPVYAPTSPVYAPESPVAPPPLRLQRSPAIIPSPVAPIAGSSQETVELPHED